MGLLDSLFGKKKKSKTNTKAKPKSSGKMTVKLTGANTKGRDENIKSHQGQPFEIDINFPGGNVSVDVRFKDGKEWKSVGLIPSKVIRSSMDAHPLERTKIEIIKVRRAGEDTLADINIRHL